MKTKLYNFNLAYTIIAFLLLSSFASIQAADKANFAGTWTFNAEKSGMGGGQGGGFGGRGGGDMVVKQEANKLTVETSRTNRDGEETKQTAVYTLDGKECKNPGFRDSESVSTAKWSADGKTLTINTKMTMNFNGETREMISDNVWSISADGKTLTIVAKSERGDRTQVYDKK